MLKSSRNTLKDTRNLTRISEMFNAKGLVILLCCLPVIYAGCRSAAQCGPGMVCLYGDCLPAVPVNETCFYSTQCLSSDPNSRCVGRICTCIHDVGRMLIPDWMGRIRCSSNSSATDPPCKDDGNCKPDQICVHNITKCLEKRDFFYSCEVTEQCDKMNDGSICGTDKYCTCGSDQYYNGTGCAPSQVFSFTGGNRLLLTILPVVIATGGTLVISLIVWFVYKAIRNKRRKAANLAFQQQQEMIRKNMMQTMGTNQHEEAPPLPEKSPAVTLYASYH